MPLKCQFTFGFLGTQNKTADAGIGTQPYAAGIRDLIWRSGIGYDEADLIFSDTRSLAGGANEDLDLVGGFSDAFGTVVSPAKIKLLIIENLNTDTQILTVKAAAANGWAGFLSSGGAFVHPGSSQMPGMLIIPAPKGVAITAGTGDLLNVANAAGNACSYRITIVGTSS